MELVRRLRFDHQPLINEHVDSLLGQVLALLVYADAGLPCDAMATRPQLPLERRDVNVLEESEAERIVYIVERSDHGLGECPLNKVSHAR